MRSAALTLRSIALGLCVAAAPACKRGASAPPEAGSAAASAAAMGTWDAWRDLSPLLEVARSHATKPTIAALEAGSKLLRQGKARAADRALAELAESDGRHWIAVARADLAAFYFTTCVRGVAWRLPETIDPKNTRAVDFAEGTPIESGDVAVEPLLVNLDAAVEARIPALTTQARIARARVTAYVSRCAPNKDVAMMGQAVFKGDLALLAAEGHLTPDLAYLWGGVQLSEYSGAAARPFLLQAREAGYDDPALAYLLGVIALEERELELADKYIDEALSAFKALGDPTQEAQAHYVRGEVALAGKKIPRAREAYETALARDPEHSGALLGLVSLELENDGEVAATAAMVKRLPLLVGAGPLDSAAAEVATARLESLVILISDPGLATICRAALLTDVGDEPEPVRRGLRYYFAATLDIRLGEFQSAAGHAALARDELAESDAPPPVDIDDLLRNLEGIR